MPLDTTWLVPYALYAEATVMPALALFSALIVPMDSSVSEEPVLPVRLVVRNAPAPVHAHNAMTRSSSKPVTVWLPVVRASLKMLVLLKPATLVLQTVSPALTPPLVIHAQMDFLWAVPVRARLAVLAVFNVQMHLLVIQAHAMIRMDMLSSLMVVVLAYHAHLQVA